MNVIEQIPVLQDFPIEQQTLIVLLSAPLLVWVVSALFRMVVINFVMAPLRRYADKTESDMDNRALAVIERPIRILMIGVAIGIISAWLDFKGDIDVLADNIANSLIITAIFFFLYNLIDIISVTTDSLNRLVGLRVEERLLPFLRVVAKVFVVVMGALIVVQEFGYSITGLVASFGIIGLAISLAAQDTAANILGFTTIVSDNPFQVGDYIVTTDVSGTVEEVGVRTTRVRKLDQSLVTIPNSSLTNAAVTNWSRLFKRRLDFYVGLTYSTNSAQMRSVLQDIRDMLKQRSTVDEESVIVNFVEFGDSALNIRIIAYVLIADWAEFTAEQEAINLDIMDIVENAGLGMAFPSTSVYIESYPRRAESEHSTVQPRPKTKPAPAQSAADEIDQGVSEATFQDNEAASSDGDGGDAE